MKRQRPLPKAHNQAKGEICDGVLAEKSRGTHSGVTGVDGQLVPGHARKSSVAEDL